MMYGDSYLTASEPLELFLNSISSSETMRQYRNKLDLFLSSIGMPGSLEEKCKKFVETASKNNQWATSCIVRFLSQQKSRADKREITAGTLRNYYKPLRVFFEANDLHIAWRKITRGFPRSRKFAQDRAPTTEEIRRLVEYPDRRLKPIVLVMSSSGIRVGAWEWLKWGHIEPIEREGKVIAARMTVYAGEAEEYKTFISPEAFASLKDWMDLRAEHGEKISPNSWVMRDLFRTAFLTYGGHFGIASAPKQMKSAGIRSMLKRAWIAQGLMKNAEDNSYEFKSSHGFRKRFKTQCELAGLKLLNLEYMLGHDTGIAGSSYYRPTDSELLSDYLKAIPAANFRNPAGQAGTCPETGGLSA
jgi:hypothetical protein